MQLQSKTKFQPLHLQCELKVTKFEKINVIEVVFFIYASLRVPCLPLSYLTVVNTFSYRRYVL